MTRRRMSPELMDLVAERFRALGETARLRILNALRSGEQTVTELVALTQIEQTNVSKHLKLLHGVGLVARRREGLFVKYRIADERVYQLCDVMCDHLHVQTRERTRVVA